MRMTQTSKAADQRGVAQRMLAAGVAAGVAIGVLAGLAFGIFAETSEEWWAAVLFVSAMAGLSAGLVLSGANAVFVSRLLNSHGTVSAVDRGRAVVATGTMALAASLALLLPIAGYDGAAVGVSAAVGIATGLAAAAIYRWALADSRG
jgi:hypothetical protein